MRTARGREQGAKSSPSAGCGWARVPRDLRPACAETPGPVVQPSTLSPLHYPITVTIKERGEAPLHLGNYVLIRSQLPGLRASAPAQLEGALPALLTVEAPASERSRTCGTSRSPRSAQQTTQAAGIQRWSGDTQKFRVLPEHLDLRVWLWAC